MKDENFYSHFLPSTSLLASLLRRVDAESGSDEDSAPAAASACDGLARDEDDLMILLF